MLVRPVRVLARHLGTAVQQACPAPAEPLVGTTRTDDVQVLPMSVALLEPADGMSEFERRLCRSGLAQQDARSLLSTLDAMIEAEVECATTAEFARPSQLLRMARQSKLASETDDLASKLQTDIADARSQHARSHASESAQSQRAIQELHDGIRSSVLLDLSLDAKRLEEQRTLLQRRIDDARKYSDQRLDEAFVWLEELRVRMYRSVAYFGGSLVALYVAIIAYQHISRQHKSSRIANIGDDDSKDLNPG